MVPLIAQSAVEKLLAGPLGLIGTIVTVVGMVAVAVVIVRSKTLTTGLEVAQDTIETLQKAREVDKEESARKIRTLEDRCLTLEAEVRTLGSTVVAGLVNDVREAVRDAIALAVSAGLTEGMSIERDRPTPRKGQHRGP